MYVCPGPLFFKNIFSNPFSDFPTKHKKRTEIKGQISRPLNTFYGLSGLYLFLCWLKTCRAHIRNSNQQHPGVSNCRSLWSHAILGRRVKLNRTRLCMAAHFARNEIKYQRSRESGLFQYNLYARTIACLSFIPLYKQKFYECYSLSPSSK